MGITIRKIKRTDQKEVRELINSILKTEFTQDADIYPQKDLSNIKFSYGDDREIFLIAEKDDQIIGSIAIKEDDITTALLRRLFVHKDFRGKGYGLSLIDKAIEFARDQRYKKIIFSGSSKMTSALALCRKKGFQEDAKINMGEIIIYRYSLDL